MASLTAALGLCIAIGASALPAQAGPSVETHIQNIGWTSWVGSTGQGWNLEAVRIYQINANVRCGRAHVAELGWLTSRCTTGVGTSITLGTTGQNRALEALELWVPGKNFAARAHVRNIGWQAQQTTQYAGQHLTIGTTGRGLAMEAAEIAFYGW